MIDERIPAVDISCFSYRDLIGQDRWEPWTPTRTGWTDVGTAVVTGRFRVVGRQCFLQVKVVPDTSVATVAGTSYLGLPITASGLSGDGSMMNLTTLVAIGMCVVDVTNSRLYVPAQLATANTMTIGAWYEV